MTVEFQKIRVVTGYDPYDLSCVALLVLYCLGEINLSLHNITRILQIVPNDELDSVGLPTLKNLVLYLRKNEDSQTKASFKLINLIFSISSFNHIQELIHHLRDAIIVSPDQQGVLSKFRRILCRSSVICELLPRVIIDSNISEFFVEDIHQIVESFQAFKTRFLSCDISNIYREDINNSSNLTSRIFSHTHTNDCFPESPFITNQGIGNSLPWLIVSADKFKVILNYALQISMKDINLGSELAETIIRYTNLNDRTRFPDILLLEIVLLRKSKNYQGTIDKMYQYFDYCRNSNVSVSSSTNFSHICQTFTLSSLYQDHGSPEFALKTLHELIDTIREKSDVHGLSHLWDILIHHLLLYPDESRVLQKSIYELLRPFNDKKNTSPEMLQYWYTFQVAMNLHQNGYIPDILELATKVSALSNYGLMDHMNRVSTEVLLMTWSFVGFDDMACCFGKPFLNNVKKHRQLTNVEKLLEDKYYSEAIKKVEALLNEVNAKNFSISFKFACTQMSIRIMLAAGNAARAQPIIRQYIDKCRETKNDHELSKAILCMVRMLNGWQQYQDSYKLMNSNLSILLQYSGSMKEEAKQLYKETSLALENKVGSE